MPRYSGWVVDVGVDAEGKLLVPPQDVKGFGPFWSREDAERIAAAQSSPCHIGLMEHPGEDWSSAPFMPDHLVPEECR